MLFQNALMRDGYRADEESPVERASGGIMGGWHHGATVCHAHCHFGVRTRRE